MTDEEHEEKHVAGPVKTGPVTLSAETEELRQAFWQEMGVPAPRVEAPREWAERTARESAAPPPPPPARRPPRRNRPGTGAGRKR